MFIETHSSSTSNGINLAFIRSLNVQAYPCGRRRSEIVDTDNDPGTVGDQYRIPFDPEARLNTEDNNRKHSGINGFTQTYLKSWDVEKKSLDLVISSYLFHISLDDDYSSPNKFGANLLTLFNDSTSTKIYANIRIEEVPLFKGFTNYNTKVLRDQSSGNDDGDPRGELDLLNSELSNKLLNSITWSSNDLAEVKKPENYYFSGLSFSTQPLSEGTSEEAYSIQESESKQTISLCILEKKEGMWQVYQPALLPSVTHGRAQDSVKVNILEATTIEANTVLQSGKPAVTIDLIEIAGTNSEDTTWQLQLSSVTTAPIPSVTPSE